MCHIFAGQPPANYRPITRSFRLRGHATSVRLEAKVWQIIVDRRRELNPERRPGVTRRELRVLAENPRVTAIFKGSPLHAGQGSGVHAGSPPSATSEGNHAAHLERE